MMSDNKNKGDKLRPKVQWTAEDRACHQAILLIGKCRRVNPVPWAVCLHG